MQQRLISRTHAYMKLFILPYGQSAMNGQTINFPFDWEEMQKSMKFRQTAKKRHS